MSPSSRIIVRVTEPQRLPDAFWNAIDLVPGRNYSKPEWVSFILNGLPHLGVWIIFGESGSFDGFLVIEPPDSLAHEAFVVAAWSRAPRGVNQRAFEHVKQWARLRGARRIGIISKRLARAWSRAWGFSSQGQYMTLSLEKTELEKTDG